MRTVGGKSASTQLCVGASSYCLMAAGTSILSAGYDPTEEIGVSGEPKGFYKGTGTSMAAPAVTGVAAILSQKYPFLGGKQLADVLLSTANSNFETPEIIYKYHDKESVECDVIYIDGKEIPKTQDGKKDIEKIKNDVKNLYSGSNTGLTGNDERTANFETKELSKEEVYGQGIMDAQKALKGLAEIDINRLKADDVGTGADSKTAFYTLDVKNYNAVFEKDIDQKKYNEKYHSDPNQADPQKLKDTENAGFKKKGSGTLGLTGNLNYEGKTIVEQGGIDLIGKQNQQVKGGIEVQIVCGNKC